MRTFISKKIIEQAVQNYAVYRGCSRTHAVHLLAQLTWRPRSVVWRWLSGVEHPKDLHFITMLEALAAGKIPADLEN